MFSISLENSREESCNSLVLANSQEGGQIMFLVSLENSQVEGCSSLVSWCLDLHVEVRE